MNPDHRTRRSEARRGARHARRILDGNPTLNDLLIYWHWSWVESDIHEHSGPQHAYSRGFRAVLRPHMPPWRSLRGMEKLRLKSD